MTQRKRRQQQPERYHGAMFAMLISSKITIARRFLVAVACSGLAGVTLSAQAAGVGINGRIDAAVQSRVENVASFSDVERYAVYRGKDEVHPVASITVKVTYRKGIGKDYIILSQTGSAIIRKFGLVPLLEDEKNINKPGNVEHSWFTSDNYEMRLRSDTVERVNGRECYAVAITPRHKAPNMIDGTLWVDAKDFSIVKVDGIASQKPSVFAGTTHMMRQYASVDGYPMATHARAVSDSWLFGRTVVTIDYSDYSLELSRHR